MKGPAASSALRDHADHCDHCRETAKAGKPARYLCAVGKFLTLCALSEARIRSRGRVVQS